MSQDIFNDINPTVTSGTELATLLNDFKDAVVSGFIGSSRPANLQAGGYWVDNTNAPTQWTIFLYDGTQDIELFVVDLANGTASISGGGELLELLKVSEDDLPPVLKFLKKRTGVGQTLDGDDLAQVEIYGTDSAGTERKQANIKVQTTDDTSISTLGAFLSVELARDASGSLLEVLRLFDGKLGLGETNPDNAVHVRGTDGAIRIEKNETSANPARVILEKKRLTANGQAEIGDELGKLEVDSADQNGTQFEASAIETTATETHTDVARGTKISFQTIAEGDTALTERMSIDGDTVRITNLEATTTTLGDVTAVKSSDDIVSPKFITDKSRATGLGQVELGDGIGKVELGSTDIDGDSFEGANIEGFATEDHTNVGRGTQIKIQTIANGGTTLEDRITIDETIAIPGDVTIGGNLTVSGTTTTVNSTTLDVADSNITVNNGGDQASADLNGAGLTVEMSDATDAVLAYDSTLTSKFKIGEVGSESEIMDLDSSQTAANKTLTSPVINSGDINTPDIDGGTVTDSSIETPARLDVKQDTEANLETYALTATSGQLCYATDTKKYYSVIDNALAPVGGGGLGGGVDVYYADNFEDTEAADLQSGNNASILGGGALQGTLVDFASANDGNIIRYTQVAASLNDYVAIPSYSAGPVQKNKTNTAIAYFDYDGNDDDILITAFDETNSVALPTSVFVKATNGTAKRYEMKFFCPGNCDSVTFAFQVKVLNIGAVLDWYSVELNTNPFAFTSLVTENVFSAEFDGSAGGSVSVVTENVSGTFTVSQNATGNFEVDYSSLGLTSPPAIVSITSNGSRVCAYTNLTASSVDILVETGTGTPEDRDFTFVMQKQSPDYKGPQESVVSNQTLGANWQDTGETITIEGVTSDPTKGTVTRDKIFYANLRNGKGRFRYEFARTVAGSAGSGDLLFSLPTINGQQIEFDSNTVQFTTNTDDVNKENSMNAYGAGYYSLEGGNYGRLHAVPYDATRFRLLADANLASVNFIASDFVYGTSPNLGLSVEFEVPIQDWDLENSITVVSPLLQYTRIWDEKATGVAGGTGVAATWTARELNKISGSFGQVSSNQITLPPGVYILDCVSPFCGSDTARLRLYNVTDAQTQADDSSGDLIVSGTTTQGAAVNTISVPLKGKFEINAAKVFEIQYIINQTVSTFDLGRSEATSGLPTVYTNLSLIKIK